MNSTGCNGSSFARDRRMPTPRRCAGTMARLAVFLICAGCAGSASQDGTAVSSERYSSAPVKLIRVLDREFVRDTKAPGTPAPGWQNPVALAVATNGDLIIADKGSGQITKTDTRGNLLVAAAYFDPRGVSTARAPRFVRIDFNGNIYVTDAVNAQVVIYDPRLTPVSTMVPPYAALNMTEGAVSGIAFGAYGEFYMADMFNGRIFRFDASGRYMAAFPSADDGSPPLNRPIGLACSALDGSVYVCESGNAQIAVFDNLGASVRTFGGSDLKDPVAIALDKQGRCFVADAMLDAILMFSRDGHYLGRLGAERIGFADFGAPTDVTVSDTSLYIADPSHGRILQIRFGAETPAP